MEILLDTNFLLTCAKQKIDFVRIANEKIGEEIKWLVPLEVAEELKDLSTRKGMKGKDKDAAKLAIVLINMIRPEFIAVKNKNVDAGIVKFVKGKDIVVATLDKKMKEKISGRIFVVKDKRDLELIQERF